MKKKQLFEKLAILFDVKEAELKPDLVLKNIHSMDSLKHMELISLVEKIKKKNISAREIKQLKKVKDVIKISNIK